MAISARNQLVGIVSSTEHGAVNDEVELTLAGGAKLIAIVTSGSKDALGLVPGKEAIALIKAPGLPWRPKTVDLNSLPAISSLVR